MTADLPYYVTPDLAAAAGPIPPHLLHKFAAVLKAAEREDAA